MSPSLLSPFSSNSILVIFISWKHWMDPRRDPPIHPDSGRCCSSFMAIWSYGLICWNSFKILFLRPFTWEAPPINTIFPTTSSFSYLSHLDKDTDISYTKLLLFLENQSGLIRTSAESKIALLLKAIILPSGSSKCDSSISNSKFSLIDSS